MAEDIHALRERARHAAAAGAFEQAANALFLAATQTHVAEGDYVTILGPLADVLTRRGDARSALTVEWYLGRNDPNRIRRALATHGARVPPVDRARTHALLGDMGAAAREMEAQGAVAAAAIYREKAKDFGAARALWSRLSLVAKGGADAYNAALVQYNLAQCAKQCGDDHQAREARVACVRLLEEAADYFESVGQRERAFDCFQVLVQAGKSSGAFEDVLEGYVNCIRILREDHLKYFALQYYEEALTAAKERGEFSAAATLAREAADYARLLGMLPTSLHYVVGQGELWLAVARAHEERGAPPEIAENAVLAAVLAFGEVGQFGQVGQLYGRLAGLDLDKSRKAHYTRAAARYANVKSEPLDMAPLPSHLRQDGGAPEVWHVDLLEWEQRGSASEACAEVLLEGRWPDLIRRKALLARMTAFAVEGQPENQASNVAAARLAEQLAQLQLYAVLSPLEALFERKDRAVRSAVLRAMKTLFFKRTFVTVRKGLRDPDGPIVREAATAVESLYFQHAFDPLSRIVRESSQPEVRASALRALAKVDTLEAAEFLLGTLDHAGPADQKAAADGLKESRGSRFLELARSTLPQASPELAQLLRDILRRRGIQA
jgi:tetratricopeptide (TPR) repeat protein